MSGAVAIDYKQVYSQTLSSIDTGKSLVPQLIGTFWYFQKRHLEFKFLKPQSSNYQKKNYIYIYIYLYYIYLYLYENMFLKNKNKKLGRHARHVIGFSV